MKALAVTGRPTALLDALTTSVIVLSGEGRVRYLNAAAEGLLAVSAVQASGRLLADLLRGTEPLAEALLQRLRDTEDVVDGRMGDCTPAKVQDALALTEKPHDKTFAKLAFERANAALAARG